jgi:hypothetical protein
VFGPDAIADSTVIKYLRQRQFPSILADLPEGSLTTVIDRAILDALEKQLFSSIQEVSADLHSSDSSASNFDEIFGFAVTHFRWVPHSLTTTQKAERVTRSNVLLRQLR